MPSRRLASASVRPSQIASRSAWRSVRIDRTAGEDVGAADEVRVEVAPDHEHLEPVGPVAQDQHGGRVPQDDIGHPRSSGRSGPVVGRAGRRRARPLRGPARLARPPARNVPRTACRPTAGAADHGEHAAVAPLLEPGDQDAPDERPGRREQQQEPEHVGDETGRHHEDAGEQDQEPVDQLLARSAVLLDRLR